MQTRPEEVAHITNTVRNKLRQNGAYAAVLRKVLELNANTPMTYRWIVAFAAGQDKEPRFSKVLEVADALGMSIRLRQ